jgi:hypothetical protein
MFPVLKLYWQENRHSGPGFATAGAAISLALRGFATYYVSQG